MSEYGCNECPENCRASANKKPIYCLYSGVDRARWYEVTSDTPPKLTAEELDSAKIGVDLAKGKDWTGYHLPDWCKVGAWVWWKGASDIGYAPSYMKITGISNEIINCDAIQGIPIAQNQISEARLRPWTKEEMAEKAGKVFDLPEGRCICLRFDGYYCDFLEGCKSEDDIAHIIAYDAETFLQYDCKLDGSPCGVLEHREGDGWVR